MDTGVPGWVQASAWESWIAISGKHGKDVDSFTREVLSNALQTDAGFRANAVASEIAKEAVKPKHRLHNKVSTFTLAAIGELLPKHSIVNGDDYHTHGAAREMLRAMVMATSNILKASRYDDLRGDVIKYATPKVGQMLAFNDVLAAERFLASMPLLEPKDFTRHRDYLIRADKLGLLQPWVHAATNCRVEEDGRKAGVIISIANGGITRAQVCRAMINSDAHTAIVIVFCPSEIGHSQSTYDTATEGHTFRKDQARHVPLSEGDCLSTIGSFLAKYALDFDPEICTVYNGSDPYEEKLSASMSWSRLPPYDRLGDVGFTNELLVSSGAWRTVLIRRTIVGKCSLERKAIVPKPKDHVWVPDERSPIGRISMPMTMFDRALVAALNVRHGGKAHTRQFMETTVLSHLRTVVGADVTGAGLTLKGSVSVYELYCYARTMVALLDEHNQPYSLADDARYIKWAKIIRGWFVGAETQPAYHCFAPDMYEHTLMVDTPMMMCDAKPILRPPPIPHQPIRWNAYASHDVVAEPAPVDPSWPTVLFKDIGTSKMSKPVNVNELGWRMISSALVALKATACNGMYADQNTEHRENLFSAIMRSQDLPNTPVLIPPLRVVEDSAAMQADVLSVMEWVMTVCIHNTATVSTIEYEAGRSPDKLGPLHPGSTYHRVEKRGDAFDTSGADWCYYSGRVYNGEETAPDENGQRYTRFPDLPSHVDRVIVEHRSENTCYSSLTLSALMKKPILATHVDPCMIGGSPGVGKTASLIDIMLTEQSSVAVVVQTRETCRHTRQKAVAVAEEKKMEVDETNVRTPLSWLMRAGESDVRMDVLCVDEVHLQHAGFTRLLAWALGVKAVVASGDNQQVKATSFLPELVWHHSMMPQTNAYEMSIGLRMPARACALLQFVYSKNRKALGMLRTVNTSDTTFSNLGMINNLPAALGVPRERVLVITDRNDDLEKVRHLIDRAFTVTTTARAQGMDADLVIYFCGQKIMPSETGVLKTDTEPNILTMMSVVAFSRSKKDTLFFGPPDGSLDKLFLHINALTEEDLAPHRATMEQWQEQRTAVLNIALAYINACQAQPLPMCQLKMESSEADVVCDQDNHAAYDRCIAQSRALYAEGVRIVTLIVDPTKVPPKTRNLLQRQMCAVGLFVWIRGPPPEVSQHMLVQLPKVDMLMDRRDTACHHASALHEIDALRASIVADADAFNAARSRASRVTHAMELTNVDMTAVQLATDDHKLHSSVLQRSNDLEVIDIDCAPGDVMRALHDKHSRVAKYVGVATPLDMPGARKMRFNPSKCGYSVKYVDWRQPLVGVTGNTLLMCAHVDGADNRDWVARRAVDIIKECLCPGGNGYLRLYDPHTDTARSFLMWASMRFTRVVCSINPMSLAASREFFVFLEGYSADPNDIVGLDAYTDRLNATFESAYYQFVSAHLDLQASGLRMIIAQLEIAEQVHANEDELRAVWHHLRHERGMVVKLQMCLCLHCTPSDTFPEGSLLMISTQHPRHVERLLLQRKTHSVHLEMHCQWASDEETMRAVGANKALVALHMAAAGTDRVHLFKQFERPPLWDLYCSHLEDIITYNVYPKFYLPRSTSIPGTMCLSRPSDEDLALLDAPVYLLDQSGPVYVGDSRCSLIKCSEEQMRLEAAPYHRHTGPDGCVQVAFWNAFVARAALYDEQPYLPTRETVAESALVLMANLALTPEQMLSIKPALAATGLFSFSSHKCANSIGQLLMCNTDQAVAHVAFATLSGVRWDDCNERVDEVLWINATQQRGTDNSVASLDVVKSQVGVPYTCDLELIRDVPQDGDCALHSLASFVPLTDFTQFRAAMLRYLPRVDDGALAARGAKHDDPWVMLVACAREEFTKTPGVSRSGWLSNVSLFYAAHYLGIRIIVYDEAARLQYVLGDRGTTARLRLRQSHFEPVRAVEAVQPSQASRIVAESFINANTVAFFGGRHPFSNHYQARFTHTMLTGKVVSFNCVEQGYMCAKAQYAGEPALAQRIMTFTDPKLMKRACRSTRSSALWERDKRAIMGSLLTSKFALPHLRECLLETGDAQLVEASPHDRFWGAGVSVDTLKRLGAFGGENNLGLMLMHIRSLARGDSVGGVTSVGVDVAGERVPPLGLADAPRLEPREPDVLRDELLITRVSAATQSSSGVPALPVPNDSLQGSCSPAGVQLCSTMPISAASSAASASDMISTSSSSAASSSATDSSTATSGDDDAATALFARSAMAVATVATVAHTRRRKKRRGKRPASAVASDEGCSAEGAGVPAPCGHESCTEGGADALAEVSPARATFTVGGMSSDEDPPSHFSAATDLSSDLSGDDIFVYEDASPASDGRFTDESASGIGCSLPLLPTPASVVAMGKCASSAARLLLRDSVKLAALVDWPLWDGDVSHCKDAREVVQLICDGACVPSPAFRHISREHLLMEAPSGHGLLRVSNPVPHWLSVRLVRMYGAPPLCCSVSLFSMLYERALGSLAAGVNSLGAGRATVCSYAWIRLRMVLPGTLFRWIVDNQDIVRDVGSLLLAFVTGGAVLPLETGRMIGAILLRGLIAIGFLSVVRGSPAVTLLGKVASKLVDKALRAVFSVNSVLIDMETGEEIAGYEALWSSDLFLMDDKCCVCVAQFRDGGVGTSNVFGAWCERTMADHNLTDDEHRSLCVDVCLSSAARSECDKHVDGGTVAVVNKDTYDCWKAACDALFASRGEKCTSFKLVHRNCTSATVPVRPANLPLHVAVVADLSSRRGVTWAFDARDVGRRVLSYLVRSVYVPETLTVSDHQLLLMLRRSFPLMTHVWSPANNARSVLLGRRERVGSFDVLDLTLKMNALTRAMQLTTFGSHDRPQEQGPLGWGYYLGEILSQPPFWRAPAEVDFGRHCDQALIGFSDKFTAFKAMDREDMDPVVGHVETLLEQVELTGVAEDVYRQLVEYSGAVSQDPVFIHRRYGPVQAYEHLYGGGPGCEVLDVAGAVGEIDSRMADFCPTQVVNRLSEIPVDAAGLADAKFTFADADFAAFLVPSDTDPIHTTSARPPIVDNARNQAHAAAARHAVTQVVGKPMTDAGIDHIVDHFLRILCRKDADELLKQYAAQPIVDNASAMKHHVRTRDGAKLRALAANPFRRGDANESVMRLGIKKEAKNPLAPGAQCKAPKPQTVQEADRDVAVRNGARVMEAMNRWQRLLDDRVIVLMNQSHTQVERLVALRHNRRWAVVDLDQSNYDASLHHVAFRLLRRALIAVGMPADDVNQYVNDREFTYVKGKGFSFCKAYQNSSGAPTTMFFNVLINLIACSMALRDPPAFLIVIGDDMTAAVGPFCMITDPDVLRDVDAEGDYSFVCLLPDATSTRTLAATLNLKTKIVLSTCCYIAKHYILFTIDGVRIIRDPLAVLAKFGCYTLTDGSLSVDKFISYSHSVKDYTAPGVAELLCKAVHQREGFAVSEYNIKALGNCAYRYSDFMMNHRGSAAEARALLLDPGVPDELYPTAAAPRNPMRYILQEVVVEKLVAEAMCDVGSALMDVSNNLIHSQLWTAVQSHPLLSLAIAGTKHPVHSFEEGACVYVRRGDAWHPETPQDIKYKALLFPSIAHALVYILSSLFGLDLGRSSPRDAINAHYKSLGAVLREVYWLHHNVYVWAVVELRRHNPHLPPLAADCTVVTEGCGRWLSGRAPGGYNMWGRALTYAFKCTRDSLLCAIIVDVKLMVARNCLHKPSVQRTNKRVLSVRPATNTCAGPAAAVCLAGRKAGKGTWHINAGQKQVVAFSGRGSVLSASRHVEMKCVLRCGTSVKACNVAHAMAMHIASSLGDADLLAELLSTPRGDKALGIVASRRPDVPRAIVEASITSAVNTRLQQDQQFRSVLRRWRDHRFYCFEGLPWLSDGARTMPAIGEHLSDAPGIYAAALARAAMD